MKFSEVRHKVGVIVQTKEGTYGAVTGYNRDLRLAQVQTGPVALALEVPEEELTLYGLPGENYGTLTVPRVTLRVKKYVVGVSILRRTVRGGVTTHIPLALYKEWFYRPPQGLYIHESIKLFPMETLQVRWADGTASAILVPVNYASVKAKLAKQAKQEETQAEPNAWWNKEEGF